MILSLLKENLSLNEEIDLNAPVFKTENFNIYEITDRTDFENFTINNNESVADHYNFSEANWRYHVTSGKVKPFVITSISDPNKCLAMFLLWHNTKCLFLIRENTKLVLPISVETNSDSSDSAYVNFEYFLPLYDLLDKYRDFTEFNPDDYIVDGQYIQDGTLKGIYKEFFKLNEDGTINYPEEIDLNKLNLTSLAANSILYSNFGKNEENEAAIHVNFYDNLTNIDANAINTLGVEDVLFYCGNETELPEVFNALPENIRSEISMAGTEEVQQRRAEIASERERQRQQAEEAENRRIAQEFDDAVIEVYNTIMEDDYEYDPDLDVRLIELQSKYNKLTDVQKQYQETNGNLNIAIREQNKKHAMKFLDNCNNIAFNSILSNDYTYNSRLDSILGEIEDDYNVAVNLKTELQNLGFEDRFNNAKQKQDQLKQEYIETRTQRLANSNTILYDDLLVIKFVGDEAHVVSCKRWNTGELKDIRIPHVVDGKKVTRIEKYALSGIYTSAIYLPKYLNYIGQYAFAHDDNPRLYVLNRSKAFLSKIKCADNIFGMESNKNNYNTNGISLYTYYCYRGANIYEYHE